MAKTNTKTRNNTRTNNARVATSAKSDPNAVLNARVEMLETMLAEIHASLITPTRDVRVVDASESHITLTGLPARVAKPSSKAKKSDAKTQAYRARVEGINSAKAEALTRTWAQALTLAAAQIVHNAGEKDFVPNAKIVNQDSPRVMLTSPQHQAFKATRDANNVHANDAEVALVEAVEKAYKRVRK